MKKNKNVIGKFELISKNTEVAHLHLPTYPIQPEQKNKVISIIPEYISRGCNGPEFIFTIDENETIISIEILY